MKRTGCMGNSGGGTITYFAACMDERISIAMPSCYVCSLRRSIAAIDHCECNYIPGFLRYFELADLACLIAPRPWVVVAGREDTIFPLAGVQEAYAGIQRIYQATGWWWARAAIASMPRSRGRCFGSWWGGWPRISCPRMRARMAPMPATYTFVVPLHAAWLAATEGTDENDSSI
jgi:hypothetical protein